MDSTTFSTLFKLWPKLSFDTFDSVSSRIYTGALQERMEKFIAALSAPFDYQEKAVADFNDWIRFRIPAYRNHSPIRSLSELPILSKTEFRKNGERFRADAENEEGVWIKGTSGSTGPPRSVFYSALFHYESVLLSVPKIAARLGLKPSANSLLYGLTIRDKPGENPSLRTDPTGYGGLHVRMGVDTGRLETIGSVFSSLSSIQPFCLSSNPSLLATITEVVSPEHARAAGIRLIVSGGGALPDDTRHRLEEMFGAVVCSAYGLSETGVVASECRLGSMHFNASLCYPELLPQYNEEGIATGLKEIILTATNNTEMPFLRYRSGDIGSFSQKPCACGEPSQVLQSLDGRVVPVFRLPGNRVFSPTQFRNTFGLFPGLKEFQMIQEDLGTIRVLFEKNSEANGFDESSLRDHFLKQLGAGVSVQLQAHSFRPDDKFQRYKTALS